jgi:glutamine synthetase
MSSIIRNDDAIEYALREAHDNDVKFIRLWFTDILGTIKGFAITINELENALNRGMGFDGSSIEGYVRADERDLYALPDPTTFSILPWRPKTNAVARMFCDIVTLEDKYFDGDPREVLRRNLNRANSKGFTYYVSPELEYFYFENSQNTNLLDSSGYFDQGNSDLGTDLRRETVLTLEELGIPVASSHHEAAPSQHEIDLRHTDALTMADTVMTYKTVVKEIAMKHGCFASFMPKPISHINGSGMHTNISLFKGDENMFYSSSENHNISEIARQFCAGLLKHAKEITLVTNQWVNSYKRLVPSYEAPTYITWAEVNRSDLIRIPSYKPGRESSRRIEYRSPDPACNPYLAFSVILAAGLEGIEKKYTLPSSFEKNVHTMSSLDRKTEGIESLPQNLWEAIQITENSSLVKNSLGEQVFNSFIANKKIEWATYSSQVSQYELDRHLSML